LSSQSILFLRNWKKNIACTIKFKGFMKIFIKNKKIKMRRFAFEKIIKNTLSLVEHLVSVQKNHFLKQEMAF